MSELTSDRPIPFPGPSVRREHGIFDARNRRPKCGSDKDYLIGYALGERLAPEKPRDRTGESRGELP